MKWEEHKNNMKLAYNYGAVLQATDIECPECGDVIYKDISVTYTTEPPQYRYTCLKCGWQEVSF